MSSAKCYEEKYLVGKWKVMGVCMRAVMGGHGLRGNVSEEMT